mmetsp:Transcript_17322/g.38784  ORF Transcript_17322/g.38784 Transcript_17322/m.38784 type:complete len:225 (+) Transcript_17322:334-1008(+)
MALSTRSARPLTSPVRTHTPIVWPAAMGIGASSGNTPYGLFGSIQLSIGRRSEGSPPTFRHGASCVSTPRADPSHTKTSTGIAPPAPQLSPAPDPDRSAVTSTPYCPALRSKKRPKPADPAFTGMVFTTRVSPTAGGASAILGFPAWIRACASFIFLAICMSDCSEGVAITMSAAVARSLPCRAASISSTSWLLGKSRRSCTTSSSMSVSANSPSSLTWNPLRT